jgi:hypothetical protein
MPRWWDNEAILAQNACDFNGGKYCNTVASMHNNQYSRSFVHVDQYPTNMCMDTQWNDCRKLTDPLVEIDGELRRPHNYCPETIQIQWRRELQGYRHPPQHRCHGETRRLYNLLLIYIRFQWSDKLRSRQVFPLHRRIESMIWQVVTTIHLLPICHRISMEETIARSSALDRTSFVVGNNNNIRLILMPYFDCMAAICLAVILFSSRLCVENVCTSCTSKPSILSNWREFSQYGKTLAKSYYPLVVWQ